MNHHYILNSKYFQVNISIAFPLTLQCLLELVFSSYSFCISLSFRNLCRSFFNLLSSPLLSSSFFFKVLLSSLIMSLDLFSWTLSFRSFEYIDFDIWVLLVSKKENASTLNEVEQSRTKWSLKHGIDGTHEARCSFKLFQTESYCASSFDTVSWFVRIWIFQKDSLTQIDFLRQNFRQ